MGDQTDYSFMKTGFDLAETSDATSIQENIVASLVTYTECALRTAATYVSHGKRKTVTAEDIKRALILEIFLFNNRPGLLEKATEIRDQLFGEGVDSDGAEEEEEEEDGADEPFATNDCECALCKAISGIYERWAAWQPANPLEEMLKRHIDGIAPSH
jgi:hypothetical protein